MPKRKIFTIRKNKLDRRNLWLALGILAFVLVAVVRGQQDSQFKPLAGDNPQAKRAWIKQLVPTAQNLQLQTGVLPSISIGQAILESDWGQSDLASRYHNLYGVKASAATPSVVLPTQEFQNDRWVTVDARFAVYPNWAASMGAHARLLAHGTTWNSQQYQHVMAAHDYQEAAQALVKDGYATDPTYANKLIEVITYWQLGQYDLPK
ncbi:glycoside hydrolase family 73 protein [Leuconostocaceae bacterium ESL0723]|nr:glycoside hydrolase family 73 protein [Leuconostocaceae bacterium ESL0723]